MHGVAHRAIGRQTRTAAGDAHGVAQPDQSTDRGLWPRTTIAPRTSTRRLPVRRRHIDGGGGATDGERPHQCRLASASRRHLVV
jgi:hypothetical protein